MTTRCQVKVWINNDNVLSYYHNCGGYPENMLPDLQYIAQKAKNLTRFNLSSSFLGILNTDLKVN